MKKIKATERGQALIIFVFAILGLMGITGLAVDGSHIFADRRQAQNAADTAALAGALAKVEGQRDNWDDPSTSAYWTNAACGTSGSVCWSMVVNTALDRANSNGYTGDITNSEIEVHIPPVSGPYSDCSSYVFDCRDYVQVFITSHIDTYFARVLGIWKMHNTVEAVALAHYTPPQELYGGKSLVVLKPHATSCTGEFSASGTTTINLDGGGIFVNSDNVDCAFKYTSGCATINLTNGADVNVVGSTDPNVGTCDYPPPISHPTEQYPFPPEPLFDEPIQCSQSPAASFVDGDGTTHFYPGFYSNNNFPPDHDVILEPGVYCVKNIFKTTNPTKMTGNNVFIYIKPGGYFDFQGGTVKLTAPSAVNDPYRGYLMYVASDFTGSAPNCSINGGADDILTGVIYAPYCDVTINGQSGTFGLTAQVVGYTMTLTGNATLNFYYNPSLMPLIPEASRTGIYH